MTNYPTNYPWLVTLTKQQGLTVCHENGYAQYWQQPDDRILARCQHETIAQQIAWAILSQGQMFRAVEKFHLDRVAFTSSMRDLSLDMTIQAFGQPVAGPFCLTDSQESNVGCSEAN